MSVRCEGTLAIKNREMVSKSILEFIFYLIILTNLLIIANAQTLVTSSFKQKRFFNVLSYGADPYGIVDNSQAFLRAWKDACGWKGRSVMVIPKGGVYMLNSLTFEGPCRSYKIVFQLKGVLKATIYPSNFFTDTWIGFLRVNNLEVKGGGVLDGQGESAWKYNDCLRNPNCKSLPASLRLDFVTNSKVYHLRSINSKNAHFNMFACSNVNITKVKLLAPSDSPNTDGIRMGNSSSIIIRNSVIGTGDDCISVVSDSQNIDVAGVVCGPGHGISIGSLGNRYRSEYVRRVTVRNCTFISTSNGVRIKTKPSLFKGLVDDIHFSNLIMKDVYNPIIIDQKYCPGYTCSSEIQASGEGIKDVTYENIKGTSTSKAAVTFDCSKSVPCKNVKLVNIDLAYNGTSRKTNAVSFCSNVEGVFYGRQQPPSCL